MKGGDCLLDGYPGKWDSITWRKYGKRAPGDPRADFYYLHFAHQCAKKRKYCVPAGVDIMQLIFHLYEYGSSSYFGRTSPSPGRRGRSLDYRVLIPLSHDFGRCVFYTKESISSLESRLQLRKPDFFDRVLGIMAYGDVDTICFNETLDIIVPGYSPANNRLRNSFKDPEKIRDPRDRSYLLAGAATLRKDLRSPGIRSLIQNHTWKVQDEIFLSENVLPVDQYVDLLNDSRFFLVPPGMAGWSPRVWDAIYAGSIPAIVSENTKFPFERFFDFSLFSVFLNTSDVGRDPGIIEETLRQIPMTTVEAMHREALRVREAFYWNEEEILRETSAGEETVHGPLFYLEAELEIRKKHLEFLGLWPSEVNE